MREDPEGTDFIIGPSSNPILDFTGSDVKSGLAVGASAVGSSASFGIWNGGNARFDPSYRTSKTLADIGTTAATLAVPSAGLSNGARSAFWSGRGAFEAANAGKGEYRLLEDTLIGGFLNRQRKFIPYFVWRAASWIYANNAKGEALAFLRNPRAESIWNQIEKGILERNGVNVTCK